MLLTLVCLAPVLLSGAPRAADGGVARAGPMVDLSAPKTVAFTEVGQRMTVDGMPIRVWAVRSRLSLGDLLQSYIDRFESAGLYLPRDVKLQGLDLPKVVAFDPKNHWSYLVWGWPEKDGTTTVVIGAADVTPHEQEPAVRPGELPRFPGARSAVVSNVEAARMLAFTTSATEAEVLDFYRQVLPSGGFQERESGTFVKGGRMVRVVARRDAKGLSVVVLDQPDSMPEAWLEEARKAVQ